MADFDLTQAFAPIVDKMTEIQKNAGKAEALSKMKMSVDPISGKADLSDVPLELLNEFAESKRQMAHIQSIYSRNLADQEKQLERAKAHPWANTLAQISGSLAAEDPNKVTRGLGRAALALNPTARQIQGEEEKTLGAMAGLEEKKLAIGKDELSVAREGRLTAAAEADRDLKAAMEKRRIAHEASMDAHTKRVDDLRGKQLTQQLQIEKMKEGSKERQQAEREAAATNLQLGRENFMMAQQQRGFAFQLSKLQQTQKLKEMKLDGSDKQILEGVSGAKASLANLEGILEEHPAMMGLGAGNKISDAIMTRYGGETFRQDFESGKKNLQAVITQAFGEKTRGFTKAGLDYNMSLIPQKTDSKEMAEAKIKQLGVNLKERLESVKKANPKADFSAWEDDGDEAASGDPMEELLKRHAKS